MALDVDTSRAFRTNAELVGLIEAIKGATEHDETHWLELKSHLDLSSAEGKFSIAKALLGLANRSPEVAMKHCEGCAYLVVGADQNGVNGVVEVDAAILEQQLAAYLGGGDSAPRYDPRYVRLGDTSVLVCTVEPPRAGDRMKTLHKGYNNFPAGTVFKRGIAKTEVASPGDIAMLEDRYLAGLSEADMDLDVAIKVSGQGLVQLTDYSVEEETAKWLARERDVLMERVPDNGSTAAESPFARLLQPRDGSSFSADRERYLRRVEQYLSECRMMLRRAVIRDLVLSEDNRLVVHATNPSDATLTSVRLKIEIVTAAVIALDGPPEESRLPLRPKWESSALGIPLMGNAEVDLDFESLRPAGRGRPGEVNVPDGHRGRVILWNLGDIHPHQSQDGDEVTIAVGTSTPVELRWTATATNRKGAQTQVETLAVLDTRRTARPRITRSSP